MVALLLLSVASIAPPAARTGAAAAELEGKAYILGGILNTADHPQADTVDVYDLKTQAWSTSPAPTPRTFPAAAAAEGRIWLVGGVDAKGQSVDLVESWAPGEQAWKTHAPLPTKRSRLTLTATNRGLAAIGGMEGSDEGGKNSNRFDLFSINGNRWEAEPNLPLAVHGHAAVFAGDRVFVLGGYSGASSRMGSGVYEFRTGWLNWKTTGSMPRPRGFFGAVAWSTPKPNTITVFGGRMEQSGFADYWTLGAGAWQKGKEEKFPARHRFAMVSYGDSVYLFGGEEAQNLEPLVLNSSIQG